MSSIQQDQIKLIQQFDLFVRITPRGALAELKARLQAFVSRNPPEEDRRDQAYLGRQRQGGEAKARRRGKGKEERQEDTYEDANVLFLED